jgi:hypothetical protein
MQTRKKTRGKEATRLQAWWKYLKSNISVKESMIGDFEPLLDRTTVFDLNELAAIVLA